MSKIDVILPDPVRIDIAARDIYGTEGDGNTELLLENNFKLAEKGDGFVPEGFDLKAPQKVIETDPARVLETINPWE